MTVPFWITSPIPKRLFRLITKEPAVRSRVPEVVQFLQPTDMFAFCMGNSMPLSTFWLERSKWSGVAEGNGADEVGMVILSTRDCIVNEDEELNEEVDSQVCTTGDGDTDITNGRLTVLAELDGPD